MQKKEKNTRWIANEWKEKIKSKRKKKHPKYENHTEITKPMEKKKTEEKL